MYLVQIQKMRNDALAIFDYALKAVEPGKLVKNVLNLEGGILTVENKQYNLSRYERIIVVGAGKAGAPMASALVDMLGDRITDGFINVKYGYSEPCRIIQINEAGHPIPDEQSVYGTTRILDILSGTGENDLVICLISGGGSALLCAPAEGLTLEDKQETTSVMLKAGADIRAMNTIRKHLSSVKGGRLAMAAHPSEVLTLILSDVIGDPVDSIASGPTAPDRTTFDDCHRVTANYYLKDRYPENVQNYLYKGFARQIPDTPKPGEAVFQKVQNVIIGNNRLAIEAARRKAEELGYNVHLEQQPVEGEAKHAARDLTARAKAILNYSNPVKTPACLIAGGETTVTVYGDGLGGRNTEFALAAALDIDNYENIVVLSGGTDGTDGPTDAAGAIADNTTCKQAGREGTNPHDYLDNNDSYHFFKQMGDLLLTGPTKTNVMDIHLMLIDK
ncbi:MAG: DUF4147 domain-containing protein [candidate division Zixibacteria bacterium]|nr:DUF4147 domain-containing protein [candidate division Zixibacteria bacterium]